MNKYIHAISANFVFFAINTVFFLVITPLAIHVMGAEYYGLWTILYAIALLSNVGTLGISAITNKFAAEYSNHIDEHIHTVLTAGFMIVTVMAVIFGLGLLGAGRLIAGGINTSATRQREFELALVWVAVGLLPQFISRVMQGYFLSQYQNAFVRTMEFSSSSLPWIGAVLLASLKKNLVGMAEWFFFSQLLVFLIYVIVLQIRVRYCFLFEQATFRKMVDFSKYMFLESTAIALFQQFDRVLVGFVLGPAIAGIYAVGTSLGLRLPIVTGQATEIMIPYASTKDSLGDYQKLYRTFRKMSQYIGFLAVGVGVFLILFMEELLGIWISPGFASQYSDVFRIIILAYSLFSLMRAGHQTLTGLGQVRFTSLMYLATTFIMLVSLGIFARKWGLLGAAVANLGMVLLLAFNLRVYRTLSEGNTQNHILQDLGLPVLLSLAAFGISQFTLPFFMKTVLLILFWMPIISRMYRDKFLRAGLHDFIHTLGIKNTW